VKRKTKRETLQQNQHQNHVVVVSLMNFLEIHTSVVSFGLEFLIAAAERVVVGSVQGVSPTVVVQIVEGVTVEDGIVSGGSP